MTTTTAISPRVGGAIICSDCGAEQRIALPLNGAAYCRRCAKSLERSAGRSAGATLSCAAAAFLLLFPANLLPVLHSHLQAASIEMRLFDGVVAYWNDDWPLMAAFVATFVIIFPFLRSLLLAGVLGSLRLGHRSPWQGRAFRYAEALRPWSMLEVYLLAGVVTYGRAAAQIEAGVGLGGWCLGAAAILLMIAEASLDRRRVWEAIHPGEGVPAGSATVGCGACHLVQPASAAGHRCPRCGRRLELRKARSLHRTVALTGAAFILFFPAMLLPMAETVQAGTLVERTIFDGVSALFNRGFWYFGIVIFTVSIAIPVMKLAGLVWMTLRVKFPRAKGLVLRTRVHRVIDEINRWSFTDPFIIALSAPLLSYPGLADVHAGPGALPFALVVVLTMFASRVFDSRLMWDAVEKQT